MSNTIVSLSTNRVVQHQRVRTETKNQREEKTVSTLFVVSLEIFTLNYLRLRLNREYRYNDRLQGCKRLPFELKQ